MEKFRNWQPPLLIKEIKEGEWIELEPGDMNYWKESKPNLHFVSSRVLYEPGVCAPDEWAKRIGALLQRVEEGVIFDCGWTDWAKKRRVNLNWSEYA